MKTKKCRNCRFWAVILIMTCVITVTNAVTITVLSGTNSVAHYEDFGTGVLPFPDWKQTSIDSYELGTNGILVHTTMVNTDPLKTGRGYRIQSFAVPIGGNMFEGKYGWHTTITKFCPRTGQIYGYTNACCPDPPIQAPFGDYGVRVETDERQRTVTSSSVTWRIDAASDTDDYWADFNFSALLSNGKTEPCRIRIEVSAGRVILFTPTLAKASEALLGKKVTYLYACDIVFSKKLTSPNVVRRSLVSNEVGSGRVPYTKVYTYQSPQSSNHPIILNHIRATNGGMSLKWQATAGRQYGVFCSTNLVNWFQPDLVQAGSNTVSVTKDITGSRQFYRVAPAISMNFPSDTDGKFGSGLVFDLETIYKIGSCTIIATNNVDWSRKYVAPVVNGKVQLSDALGVCAGSVNYQIRISQPGNPDLVLTNSATVSAPMQAQYWPDESYLAMAIVAPTNDIIANNLRDQFTAVYQSVAVTAMDVVGNDNVTNASHQYIYSDLANLPSGLDNPTFVIVDGCNDPTNFIFAVIGREKVSRSEMIAHGLYPQCGIYFTGENFAGGDVSEDHAMWVSRFFSKAFERLPFAISPSFTIQQALDYASVREDGSFNPTSEKVRIVGCADMYIDELYWGMGSDPDQE